ncbi:MAG: hypothetical protein QF890_10025 [Myxococcota bacterium]|jgi:rubrerythrin|nr:hypothetical protein [Deltaproteobacteria bacterium]MCP4244988.1 hypothetical protein [bacterium]MDP6075298.1 hypothetical protein [Myxococcota bacterium]MCP4908417.1 hypothetical protein [bacterium]MDP6244892.1 hypothetical protein [Myxococcota bacterium]
MPSPKEARDALARIETAITSLCEEVGAIRKRLDSLDGGNAPMSTPEIIEFLDGYRVAEATAAAGFGAWIATSDTECLRGGLRMVQLREAAHAKLFEERIKELGGSPKAEASEELETFLIGTLGDPDKSDAEKLQTFVAQAGDPKVIEQLEGFAARMDADQETQFLLRAAIQDERTSVEFLHQACELLCGGSTS